MTCSQLYISEWYRHVTSILEVVGMDSHFNIHGRKISHT